MSEDDYTSTETDTADVESALDADVPDAEDDDLYGDLEIKRRQVAKTLAAISAGGAVTGFTVDAIAGLRTAGHLAAEKGREEPYVKGTRLVTEKGDPVTLDTLPREEVGSTKVFPEKKGGGALKTSKATTVLMRFPEGSYEKPTNVKDTVKGYVAYSAVCTHEGCAVGVDGKRIVCPCHKSVYDPTEGAKVTGGPAPRPLPQLPLGLSKRDKTLLIATGPFEGPIGVSH